MGVDLAHEFFDLLAGIEFPDDSTEDLVAFDLDFVGGALGGVDAQSDAVSFDTDDALKVGVLSLCIFPTDNIIRLNLYEWPEEVSGVEDHILSHVIRREAIMSEGNASEAACACQ